MNARTTAFSDIWSTEAFGMMDATSRDLFDSSYYSLENLLG